MQFMPSCSSVSIPDSQDCPWSRNNRALRGKTVGADKKASKAFHSYADWIRTELFDKIACLVEPDWFAQTGLFDPEVLNV